ncbi:MAG: hypothetical protein ACI83O_000397 [Patescibacteria group bacterium]|jgi:hypothetical protein
MTLETRPIEYDSPAQSLIEYSVAGGRGYAERMEKILRQDRNDW